MVFYSADGLLLFFLRCLWSPQAFLSGLLSLVGVVFFVEIIKYLLSIWAEMYTTCNCLKFVIMGIFWGYYMYLHIWMCFANKSLVFL